ncbi:MULTISPECIES: ATP-grasp domain-containing protein [Ectothiorhodospira]|uniref:ATP-grasp domain-containing protein n=1 Tax=Ectothiorhodospira TaxID=1051 RepID=UPI0019086961|nr:MULTISPECIES: hypothetical protein [Ectothiorhodospira]MBK1674785.1 hypothetical protein [Ectothiorhodospira shaposhnikovii]MCG5501299.1 hypothetical protein [Ectothiorhodospira lacustris]
MSRLVPASLGAWMRRYVPMLERDRLRRLRANPFVDEPRHYDVPGCRVRLGILEEVFQYHKHYIAACREMGISYRLLDISRNDWLDAIGHAGCDAFLAWPSANTQAWRDAYDNRLRIMEQDLGLLVFPTYRETWLFEDKCRQRDWMDAKGVPHPETALFYHEVEARDFAANVTLPVVVKTRLGAASSGVWIVRSRSELQRIVARAFSSGLVPRRRHRFMAERGAVLIQEYLEDVDEWRLVRIGELFFGHRKGRRGSFHSGSGRVDWTPPEDRHLDLLEKVTEAGGFLSMDVDVFETSDGRLLVNELQTVFGASVAVDQARVNGKRGRFVRNVTNASWVFEEGDFARNACANARVQVVLQMLEARGQR